MSAFNNSVKDRPVWKMTWAFDSMSNCKFLLDGLNIQVHDTTSYSRKLGWQPQGSSGATVHFKVWDSEQSTSTYREAFKDLMRNLPEGVRWGGGLHVILSICENCTFKRGAEETATACSALLPPTQADRWPHLAVTATRKNSWSSK